MSLRQGNNLLADLDWAPQDVPPSVKALEETCLARTNWPALIAAATRAKGQPCTILPSYRAGRTSLARLLQFEDKTHWVARVQLRESTPESSRRLRVEIDAMALLRAAGAPVPRVFVFDAGGGDGVGSAHVLMEFFQGNIALGEADKYERPRWGLIPLEHRSTCYKSMALAHVRIASARLPQIGSVTRLPDGTFTAGPIPGIGGPFFTASSFVEALASTLKFPYDNAYLRKVLPPSAADEIIEGTKQFPSRLAALARSGRCFTRGGPFPIRHPDLFHSNVVVTKAFAVIGVIDWENSHTVPWELLDAPCFLRRVPRLLNPLEKYDAKGRPLDVDEACVWADEEAYVRMVRDAERDAGADDGLSGMLGDRDARDLAGVVHSYSEGKIGLYARAMDYFEEKYK